MSDTFFTADSHYSHKNIMKYSKRPFSTTDEMDEEMIKRWNEVVKPKDDVYHLGDFAWDLRKAKSIMSRLNGKITLIKGNHDKFGYTKAKELGFVNMYDYKRITIEGQKIILCHYAMRTWDCSFHGSWMLFGHSHGTLQEHGYIDSDEQSPHFREFTPLRNTMDVGVDTNNFYPYSFDDIKQRIPKGDSVK